MKPIIGVIGGGSCSSEIAGLAEEVGRLIAKRDAILICGGLGGVMEAACRGAHEAGGMTIGVLPCSEKTDANRFVDIPIVTNMGDARNIMIVRSSDAVIAIGGEYGTLSEIAFCLKFEVPVIGLKTWDMDLKMERADTAEDAVSGAFGFVS